MLIKKLPPISIESLVANKHAYNFISLFHQIFNIISFKNEFKLSVTATINQRLDRFRRRELGNSTSQFTQRIISYSCFFLFYFTLQDKYLFLSVILLNTIYTSIIRFITNSIICIDTF